MRDAIILKVQCYKATSNIEMPLKEETLQIQYMDKDAEYDTDTALQSPAVAEPSISTLVPQRSTLSASYLPGCFLDMFKPSQMMKQLETSLKNQPRENLPRAVQSIQGNTEYTNYAEFTTIHNSLMVNDRPSNILEALKGSVSWQWQSAITTVLENLENHQALEVVPLQALQNYTCMLITLRIVLQFKIDINRAASKYKAHLVVHGFKQYYSLNYNVAYIPLIRLAMVCLVLGKAIARDLEIDQMDMVGGFFKTKVEEEIYLAFP